LRLRYSENKETIMVEEVLGYLTTVGRKWPLEMIMERERV
jgi:hypothetical protein